MTIQDPSKPLILVVDGDPTARTTVSKALELSGFSIIEAENEDRAHDVLAQRHPDCVVLDAAQARASGYRLCASIRVAPRGATVPIVALSSTREAGHLSQAYEAGVSDIASKPVNGTVLAHRIKGLIRMRDALDALQRNEARLASAHKMVQMGSWDYYPSTGRLEGSDDFHRLLGVPAGSLRTLQDLIERVHMDDRESLRKAVVEAEILQVACNFQHRVQDSDGAIKYFWGLVEPRPELDGELVLCGATLNDTDRVLAKKQIQSLEYYDSLTGLPNRAFLKRQLSAALGYSRRTHGSVAVVFLDLDHFKHVNDSLGHKAGDELLQSLGERLSQCLRATDTMARYDVARPDSTVSRFGGDEFVILLTHLTRWEHAVSVIRRVFEVLEKPFELDGQEVFATVSVGISLFPSDGNDSETLLKNADVALHKAKDKGRNTWQFYNASMNDTSSQRLSMETSLRKALSRDEFVLHYQPQVDVRAGRIVGVEALIRWNRGGSLVPPGEFIPIAEDTGLIVAMGEWVLKTACAQGKQWMEAGLGEIKVSLNLSPRQFQKESTAAILRMIEASGLGRDVVELEITEGVLCVDAERTARILNDFKAAGAHICIDDFGTGYSSLSYLRSFPIDTIKIDRSFVCDITPGGEALLTRAIINIAHSLRMSLVAEGVETSDQRDYLLREGCPVMQGYFFGRPMPAGDLTRLLEKQQSAQPAPAVARTRTAE